MLKLKQFYNICQTVHNLPLSVKDTNFINLTNLLQNKVNKIDNTYKVKVFLYNKTKCFNVIIVEIFDITHVLTFTALFYGIKNNNGIQYLNLQKVDKIQRLTTTKTIVFNRQV